MRNLIAKSLSWLAGKIQTKAAARTMTFGGGSLSSGAVDRYGRIKEPSQSDLMRELRGVAWACASVNAAVCASYYPRLYVATHEGQGKPKTITKALTPAAEAAIRSSPHLPPYITKAMQLEEVLEHPLLALFRHVNDDLDQFDLWELTTLYQEVSGCAYWRMHTNALGVPHAIQLLEAHLVTPRREGVNNTGPVQFYEYNATGLQERFTPDDIIHFKYPDPRDPYAAGFSPIRACFEQVVLSGHYTARRNAIMTNDAVPGAIVSPDEQFGEEERYRLEAGWNQKFRMGGAGKVLVAESKLQVHLLERSLGDLALLAESKATKEDIANAFHVPLSYLTAETNMANIQAAEQQHRALAIGPRLKRRDEKINAKLVPLFDKSGRLFVMSDNPSLMQTDTARKQEEQDLKNGVRTINEIRAARGEQPVAWGEKPWLPVGLAQTDLEVRALIAPDAGRTRSRRKDVPARKEDTDDEAVSEAVTTE